MTYDNRDRQLMNTNSEDVGEFHHKFGLYSTDHRGPRPQEVNEELIRFRSRFLLEELLEFLDGVGASLFAVQRLNEGNKLEIEVDPDQEIDHGKAFDALLDIVYVAMGTAHLMGYPWQAGWERVQQANMSKVRAQKDGSDSKRGSSFDVVKPPGWTPPDIEGLLKMYGFHTEERDQ